MNSRRDMSAVRDVQWRVYHALALALKVASPGELDQGGHRFGAEPQPFRWSSSLRPPNPRSVSSNNLRLNTQRLHVEMALGCRAWRELGRTTDRKSVVSGKRVD